MPDQEAIVDLYGASYGGFERDVYTQVRREAWGEEIGQNDWLTRDELERFMDELQLDSSSRVLEIGCGSGGPALHLARLTGCEIVGVDVHEDGVVNASRMAHEAGLAVRARFVRATRGRRFRSRADRSTRCCASMRSTISGTARACSTSGRGCSRQADACCSPIRLR